MLISDIVICPYSIITLLVLTMFLLGVDTVDVRTSAVSLSVSVEKFSLCLLPSSWLLFRLTDGKAFHVGVGRERKRDV